MDVVEKRVRDGSVPRESGVSGNDIGLSEIDFISGGGGSPGCLGADASALAFSWTSAAGAALASFVMSWALDSG